MPKLEGLKFGGIHICPKCGCARSNNRNEPCKGCKRLAEEEERRKAELKKNPLKIKQVDSIEELKEELKLR